MASNKKREKTLFRQIVNGHFRNPFKRQESTPAGAGTPTTPHASNTGTFLRRVRAPRAPPQYLDTSDITNQFSDYTSNMDIVLNSEDQLVESQFGSSRSNQHTSNYNNIIDPSPAPEISPFESQFDNYLNTNNEENEAPILPHLTPSGDLSIDPALLELMSPSIPSVANKIPSGSEPVLPQSSTHSMYSASSASGAVQDNNQSMDAQSFNASQVALNTNSSYTAPPTAVIGNAIHINNELTPKASSTDGNISTVPLATTSNHTNNIHAQSAQVGSSVTSNNSSTLIADSIANNSVGYSPPYSAPPTLNNSHHAAVASSTGSINFTNPSTAISGLSSMTAPHSPPITQAEATIQPAYPINNDFAFQPALFPLIQAQATIEPATTYNVNNQFTYQPTRDILHNLYQLDCFNNQPYYNVPFPQQSHNKAASSSDGTSYTSLQQSYTDSGSSSDGTSYNSTNNDELGVPAYQDNPNSIYPAMDNFASWSAASAYQAFAPTSYTPTPPQPTTAAIPSPPQAYVPPTSPHPVSTEQAQWQVVHEYVHMFHPRHPDGPSNVLKYYNNNVGLGVSAPAGVSLPAVLPQAAATPAVKEKKRKRLTAEDSAPGSITDPASSDNARRVKKIQARDGAEDDTEWEWVAEGKWGTASSRLVKKMKARAAASGSTASGGNRKEGKEKKKKVEKEKKIKRDEVEEGWEKKGRKEKRVRV
ncbi:hypothetical protein B0J14DRAFT_658679 [Halenospora varia]|nr:hypothetical protein B0J14DRAFT_658679 [Halenospora varia]